MSLPFLIERRAAAALAGIPRKDTAVIQVWLGGGPSHLDMYDLKPAAPVEIRGPFKPIRTNVPGLNICELLPLQAKRMNRLALIRSLHHTSNEHPVGAHWTQTGHFSSIQGPGGKPSHPSAGSVSALVRGPNRPGMPPYVHIAPDPMGFPVFVKVHESAFLGARYNPLRVESARKVTDPNRTHLDNLIGKVQFSVPNLELFPEVSLERLEDRSLLGHRLEQLNRRLESSEAAHKLSAFQRQALDLVTSDRARTAFDLTREDPRLRDRFGQNAWGQGLLLCRRLVEAGVTFVTLNTDAFSGQWDNHNNLQQSFQEMLPVYDQVLTTLLDDLVDRGLYERVLVLVWGEFGRTPKLNAGGGRDHWGRGSFALLGGAGLRGGVVVGATTPDGGEPRDRPIWPEDVLATVYRVLGIDPDTELIDPLGRPIKVLASGKPIRELL